MKGAQNPNKPLYHGVQKTIEFCCITVWPIETVMILFNEKGYSSHTTRGDGVVYQDAAQLD